MVQLRLPYFPGCAASRAINDDMPARTVLKFLDIELVEIPNWTCCGALFSVLKDLVGLLEPMRNLACIGKVGAEVITSCPFCYNTLKRTNKLLREDSELREKLSAYIGEPYDGRVEVLHFLEVLRDKVGFEELRTRLKVKLKGLKTAPLYGCMLLRPPEEIMLDDPERPKILDDLLTLIGCEVVDFGYKTKCCGSYLVVNQPDVIDDCVGRMLSSAVDGGAEAVVTTCALCHFNLDSRGRLPVFYISQLLAMALGAGHEVCRFDLHRISPLSLLRDKEII